MSRHTQGHPESRVDSTSHFMQRSEVGRILGTWWINIKRTLTIFQSFSVFSVIVIVGACAWLCRHSQTSRLRDNGVFYSLLTLAIYCGGYILILVEPRYLWIACVLLMIIGFHLGGRLLGSGGPTRYRAALILVLATFGASFGIAPLKYLIQSKWAGRYEFDLSQTLINTYNIQGSIASDINWGPTMYLAFYCNCRYYGLTGHGETGREIRRELAANDIDYYFVWTRDFKIDALGPELINDKSGRLRIYRLKQKAE